MRNKLHGHVPRVMFLMSLLVAAVSCVRGADAPEDRAAEYTKTDLAELEQSALQTDSTATLPPEVKPGATIDRPQLAQLLGDRVPAAAGESCLVLGQVCAPRAFAATTVCSGFSNTCDSSGTQSGVFVDFVCLNNAGNATCTVVVQDPTVVTVSCSRVTNGTSCGTASCGAPFCLGYSDFCAQSTTLVHNCTSAGVCSNEVCTGQVATQEAVGTCQRNTDGAVCLVGNGAGCILAVCSNQACVCTESCFGASPRC
jgi:hypothetical protein